MSLALRNLRWSQIYFFHNSEMTSYPPDSLAESILKLPEWIQKVKPRFWRKILFKIGHFTKNLNTCEIHVNLESLDEFSITNCSLNVLRSRYFNFSHLLFLAQPIIGFKIFENWIEKKYWIQKFIVEMRLLLDFAVHFPSFFFIQGCPRLTLESSVKLDVHNHMF